MSYRLLFIFALLLSAVQVQAVENANKENDNRFYDRSTEQFVATVGQFATRSGYIHFADASIPPDPNIPVDRALGGDTDFDFDFGSDVYSVSIDGDDSGMFTAMIVSVSASENGCTVRITYHPTTVGTHNARLVATCSNAGSPVTYVNLCGQGITKPGDVDGNGQVGISDVTKLIDMILTGE